MNRWLQTRQYICPRCGANYLHDRAYKHNCLIACAPRFAHELSIRGEFSRLRGCAPVPAVWRAGQRKQLC